MQNNTGADKLRKLIKLSVFLFFASYTILREYSFFVEVIAFIFTSEVENIYISGVASRVI